MSVIEQLRQKQAAEGLVADSETGAPVAGTWAVNPAWETAPGRFPGLEADAFKAINIGPAPRQGYLRIFPATFGSIVAVPQSFKDEFWHAPSPFCRVEGLPDHPDFEANLAAIESFYTPE